MSGKTRSQRALPSPRRVVQPQKEALLPRPGRIEGQVWGVARMVAEDRYCVDIMVQIGALRSVLDSLSVRLLEPDTKGCVARAVVGAQGG